MMQPEVLYYQFDDIKIDLRAGRVLREGFPVSLEPKAYDLLVLLASRSGELVTRQEVFERVWSGVYVTDNAVARVVAQLRRALGDSARGARYIETVPTRGYRFIEPVIKVTAPVIPAAAVSRVTIPPPAPAPPPSVPSASLPFPGAPAPHPLWAAGLAVLALTAIVLAWRAQGTAPVTFVSTPARDRVQLTSSPALDAFPAWSPDGQTLAYASDRSGRFEIFLRDLVAGGDRVALTSDGQHNVQPAWSPDGTQIAYHSSGRGGIWVLPRAGGIPRQISAFGSRPAWSPDGTRIAFQSAPYTEPSNAAFEAFGPSSLWVVDAAGTGAPRRLTEGWRPEGSHARPAWFPDSTRLLFASQRLDGTSFWTLDLDSGAYTRVHDAGTRALDITLTGDGRAMLYVRLYDHFDLWKLPLTADGTAAGAPELVLPPSELDLRHVAIHPSGTQIAYVAMSTVSGLRSLTLRRTGVPAGPSTRVAEDAVRRARRPSFHPDGQSVAFERQAAGGRPHVWLLDLARGSVKALTQGDLAARSPDWDRHGRRVYVEVETAGQHTLQAVDAETGQMTLVANLDAGDTRMLRPRLSPDGTRLAYTRSSEGQLEVWVRTLADGRDGRVARAGDGVDYPGRAPDGRALAVDVWRDGHAQAHVVDLVTGDITQVSSGVDQAWVRSWSPDGTRIAFAGSQDGRWDVWSVGRDGSSLQRLTTYGDEHHYVRNPEWSPQGDRLVYEFASFAGNIWALKLR